MTSPETARRAGWPLAESRPVWPAPAQRCPASPRHKLPPYSLTDLCKQNAGFSGFAAKWPVFPKAPAILRWNVSFPQPGGCVS